MEVELEGSQNICVTKFFEGGSAEEAEGEGWRCGGGKFISNCLRKEGLEHIASVEV